MNRNHYFLFALLFFIAAGLSSCEIPEKPDTNPIDEKAPLITIVDPVMVGPEAFMTNQYSQLDSLGIEIRFEDNVELKEYEINIYYAGDLYFLKTDADPLDKKVIGTLTGDDRTINLGVYVDFDPYAGPYVFEVTCRDAAGLESVARTYIMVNNAGDPSSPGFAVSSPSTTMIDTFKIGDNIIVSANVADNDMLTNAMVRVRNTYNKEMLPGSQTWWQIGGASSFNIQDTIYVGPVAPGDYDIELYARDTTQNLGLSIVPIYIKPNHQ